MPRFSYEPTAPHLLMDLPKAFAAPFMVIYDHAEDDPQAADFANLRAYLCGQTEIFPIDAMINIAKSGEYPNGFCLPMEAGSAVSLRFASEWDDAKERWPNTFTPEMLRFSWFRLNRKELAYATRILKVLGNYASPVSVKVITNHDTMVPAT